MAESVEARLSDVRGRVAAACRRVNRYPADVTILAVTKTFGPEAVAAAAECGLSVFGESRVQEARQKIPRCPGRLEWHMIGHLQSNKVRDAVALFRMVHAVDSLKLLERVNRESEAAGKVMPVCLEVNVSGESSKFGLDPSSVPAVLEAAQGLFSVDVTGLMTVPPFTPEAEPARRFFSSLRELRDQWCAQSGFELPVLSMGMSNDFEVAIEEGATLVRLGTALFGRRQKWEKQKTREGE